MSPALVNSLETKVPPAALVLVLAAMMWLVSAYEPYLPFTMPWRVPIAIAFVGVGIVIAATGIVAFHRAGTTVNPTKPETTSAMVLSGVYRWSRNPMYLGFLFVLTGWAVFLSHVLALAFLPIFVAYMNRFQIVPEERALSAKFGRAFTTYRSSVRRWL